jgi:hypothetical protein
MGAPPKSFDAGRRRSGWTSAVAQPQPVLLPQDEQV